MADIYVKKGDREPSVAAILKASNAVINLTGCTVKFLMRSAKDGTAKVSASAVVVSAVLGSVRYDWALADTDTAGQFYAEWEITKASGNKITVPNHKYMDVVIMEDIG